MPKILLVVGAALAVLVAVASLGSIEPGGRPDARVEMVVQRGTGVGEAVGSIQSKAESWGASVVGEDTEDSDGTSLTLSLPGSALAGAVAELRTLEGAADVDVSYEVDPEQVASPTLASPGSGTEPPEPVRLQVVVREAGSGPLPLMILSALVVLVVIGVLVVFQRRADDDADVPPGDPTAGIDYA